MDEKIGKDCEDKDRELKKKVDVGYVIIKKLDGNEKGGGDISDVEDKKSKIILIGKGENIDDFEKLKKKKFVRKMIGMGEIEGLIEKVNELKLDENEEIIEKIKNGKLKIRDMYEKLKNIMKMGKFYKIMGMIKGFSKDLI
jgi:signal recognition particle subunit SRP54